MLSQLKELYTLLTRDQRRQLFRLQGVVLCMAVCEVLGVLSMGPFMALVGDMQRLTGDGFMAQVYQASNLGSPRSFLILTGVAVLFLLAIASFISVVGIWRLSLYAARVGAELSERLFTHYMRQEWLFHASGSSSQLVNKIAQECGRTTSGIIVPLMQMNAKLGMASLMAIAIFIYNPVVALAGLCIFAVSYLIIYRTVRRKLIQSGSTVSDTQRLRFKLMGEGFGGIKDTLLLGRDQDFIRRFHHASRDFARGQGVTSGLSQAPRYIMELVAYGSVITLIIYLLAVYQGDVSRILPVLSVYALAGFKLLPAFQQSYQAISQIRSNLSAFENLRDDLRATVISEQHTAAHEHDKRGYWPPQCSIRIDRATFTYPGKETPALRNITLDIPKNHVIGLVGATGSGKSTAIDLLLGLIEPQEGQLLIDGQAVTSDNKRAWQNSLGFVPQSIFLADSTIRENIAFGLPPDEIDDARVERAARMAHLTRLLDELHGGLNTRVGERGIQLSGGQRQRIGIARALYHDADVLVLDEATSALDGITEKLIMDAIHDFSGQKTIIMIAHRLKTVQACDSIYMLEQGEIIDQGTYTELENRNLLFKNMAQHA